MKQWLKNYLKWNQNFIACVSVLLTAIVIGEILFSYPRVGAADFGEYDQTLFRMGLSRTAENAADENRYFSKVIEDYDIIGVDMERLTGATPTESMIYPIAVISFFCQLFGLKFSSIYLMLFYILAILYSVYVITKSLYHYLENRTIVLTMLLCLCIFTSDTLVTFNSLYADGMIVTSFFIFMAAILRAMVANNNRTWSMLPVLITAYLFLTSQYTMPIMVIILVPLLIYLIIKKNFDKKEKRQYILLSFFGLLALIVLCFRFIWNSEQMNNRINLYAATYHGAFMVTEDQERALNFFELPREYAEDIGKSYYLSEESYIIPPYAEEAEEKIYSHLSYSKLFQYYMKYPADFMKAISTNLSVTSRMNTDKYLYIDRNGNSNTGIDVEKWGYYPFARSIFMPTTIQGVIILIVISLLSIMGSMINRHIHKKDNAINYLVLVSLLIGLFRLCVTTFFTGTFENRSNLFSYMFFMDILVVAVVMEIIQLILALSSYLEEQHKDQEIETPYVVMEHSPITWSRMKIHTLMKWMECHIWSRPLAVTMIMTGIAALVMGYVFFLPERIGAYNNGDFGRMMTAMGLEYTDFDWLHQEDIYLKVIENYRWHVPFDWSSLTPLNPTMSQVFLAAFIRLTAGNMGFMYSTVYATVLYMILLTAGFGACVWGLYKLFGKKTIVFSAIIIVVLFGSYNLGWFNSLFSEATEMTGFLMTLGCSLLLISRKRGTAKWYEWILLLCSIRFFIGAKSQVTPEIVFWGIWAVILAVYHKKERNADRPKRRMAGYILQILFVTGAVTLMARSAVIIYQKDGEISSQDTIYSSVFCGVLLVADDPVKALDELGLDSSLIVDKGKNPYLGDGAYYCQPRTPMAEQMIYSKVDTFDVLRWYLEHPKKLLFMLDHAAHESAALMPDYVLYSGENAIGERRIVSKFNLWASIRGNITPKAFWQYFILYGTMIIVCFITIIRKQTDKKYKLFAGFFIIIIFSGAMQFPLSVIGNGFIDNIKQLFMFRLIHDIIISSAIYIGVIWIWKYLETKTECHTEEKEEQYEQHTLCSNTLLQRGGSSEGDSIKTEIQDDGIDYRKEN